ncbi:RpiR family transcriptional regulator [Tetragenococcus halophilus subsp. flandriensis]|uniref:MurR/RpiR family transcriptional regulator n=1 Tax=Tetragenococcus halophilus TaxID=51669 RepID=UPI0023E94804|nr:MurR/RpiR family transcriptional regulator [Tetragenococcus halophilus]GMA09323.1 RpiR family transcriptional regulator [Tetragenococcus halophilus subsp. flandriensis]
MDNLKNLIQVNYLSFTKKEKQIADFILGNIDKAKSLSISELANACNVADSTISLFAKKIGLSGFKELNVYLNNQHQNILENTADDSGENVIKKVFESNIRSLENTSKLVDHSDINKAISIMNNSKKMVFFALGGSTPIALDAYHKFLRSPLDVEFNLEYHMQLLKAGKLNEQSCAFIISHRGNNPDILRLVNLLKDNNVPIISITSFDNTPLVDFSEVSFLTPTEELDYNNAGIYTRRVSQLVLVDLLFTLCISSQRKEAISNLEKMQEALKYTK